MKTLKLIAAAGALALAVGGAQASTLSIVDAADITSAGSTEMELRYRMHQGQWDVAALPDGPTSGDRKTLDNNPANLNDRLFDFTASFSASDNKFTFRVFDENISREVADSSADPYNAIRLRAQANNRDGADPRSMSISNLALSVAGGTAQILPDLSVTDSSDTTLLWLFSGSVVDFDWTLTGQLRGVCDPSQGSCNENVRFSIDAQSGVSVIPLPAAGWLLLAAFGGLGAAARRKVRANA